MDDSFCRWIIGGEAVAIVWLAAYIRAMWKERRAEYVEELKSLRKMLSGEEE